MKLVKGFELVGKYYKLPVQDCSQMFSKLRQTVMQSTRAAIYKTRLVLTLYTVYSNKKIIVEYRRGPSDPLFPQIPLTTRELIMFLFY